MLTLHISGEVNCIAIPNNGATLLAKGACILRFPHKSSDIYGTRASTEFFDDGGHSACTFFRSAGQDHQAFR